MRHEIRTAELRRMLSTRRREILGDMHGRIRDGRAERLPEVGDTLDRSDADVQDDLELALLQLRAETLARIDEALVRLDAGDYGSCAVCSRDIAPPRLRALPFAVRCHACEGKREAGQDHARQMALRGARPSLLSEDVAGV